MGACVSGLVDCWDQIAQQIRDGLETEVFGIQVETGYVFNPSPPTIDVFPGRFVRDRDSAAFASEEGPFDGGYFFTVRARIHTADTTESQRLLAQMMDDTSDLCIAAALYSDPTLNGHADDIDIRDVTGFNAYPSGEGDLLGFEFTVLVLAAQS